MATGADETTLSPTPDSSDHTLLRLTQCANYLRDNIRRLEKRLSSHRSIEHRLASLLEFESIFQETLTVVLGRETEEDQKEPLQNLSRRAERLSERIERLVERLRRGHSLLEAILGCEDFRREMFGDLFCREFNELSLEMRGHGEESREGGKGKEKKD